MHAFWVGLANDVIKDYNPQNTNLRVTSSTLDLKLQFAIVHQVSSTLKVAF